MLYLGDGHANQGSGHVQPGFRPEPEIVYIWGLSGRDRLPNPSTRWRASPPTFLEGFGGRSGPFRPQIYTISGSGLSPGCRWPEPSFLTFLT